jgi:hypothetical protein
MSEGEYHASLRESVKRSIGDFLYSEGFKKNEVLPEGIFEIINLIQIITKKELHYSLMS